MRVLKDRYELLEMLGAGGFGQVHRAKDRDLGRVVAVKTLLAVPDEGGAQARFRREARAAAGLSHPHIATVHDYGIDGDLQFLVMELIHGESLAELLRVSERLPTERAAAIAMDVLEALEHSHAAGVVHRDIKPANIMIDRSGRQPRVKVVDFGIARVISESLSTLTPSGTVVGTLSYMPPEVLQGRPADSRSDLYSLGCVLYELLTGRPPVKGDNLGEVIREHVERTPDPPSGNRPELSEDWDRVVLRALAKDPAQRYSGAAAMHTALQTLVNAPPPAPAVTTKAPVPTVPEEPPALPEPATPPCPPGVVSHQPREYPGGPAVPPRVVPDKDPAESATPRMVALGRPDRKPSQRTELARAIARAHISIVARLTCAGLALVALFPLAGYLLPGVRTYAPLPDGLFASFWLALVLPALAGVGWVWQSIPPVPGPLGRVAVYLMAVAAAGIPVAMAFGRAWWNLPTSAAFAAAGFTLWAFERMRAGATAYQTRPTFHLATLIAMTCAAWLLSMVIIVGFDFFDGPRPEPSPTLYRLVDVAEPSGHLRVSVPADWRLDRSRDGFFWKPALNHVRDDPATNRPALRASKDPSRSRLPKDTNPGITIGLTTSTRLSLSEGNRNHALPEWGECEMIEPVTTRTINGFTAEVARWHHCKIGVTAITEAAVRASTFTVWIRVKERDKPDPALVDRILDTVRFTAP